MNTITGHTQLTGLLGSPVRHSISPLMHNTAFESLGIDCVYLCFEVDESNLKEAVEGLRTVNIKGFNLTMPNKNKILEYLDDLSPAARLIGAVNTVENRDGKLIGHNTDGLGFMQCIAEQNISVKGAEITLMGIGGAATAICTQAALDGADTIHIFARKESRHMPRILTLIENLKKECECKLLIHDNEDHETLKECLKNSSLLINATSVGMAPNTDACILPDASYLHKNLAVADIIYNPWETKLLAMAKKAGCVAFNGYPMLIYQGAEAFKIWTGQEMPVELVKEKLKK